MTTETSSFLKAAGRAINSGQSRSLVLSGNIYDIFRSQKPDGSRYLPLTPYLRENWRLPEYIVLVYELNGPIRFASGRDSEELKSAWVNWRTGLNENDITIRRMLADDSDKPITDAATGFERNLDHAIGRPTLALEFLRQLCLCSRSTIKGKPTLERNLIVIIEGADMIIPEGEIARLSDSDRHRIAICHDWFSDPDFIGGGDSCILISESCSSLNHRIANLPQMMEIHVPAPGLDDRLSFINNFIKNKSNRKDLIPESDTKRMAISTAGLSIQALEQLLKAALHAGTPIIDDTVTAKVEEYIKTQLGEDVVEFKKPSHTLNDVIGFSRLKTFFKNELIPRLNMGKEAALTGAAVGGPIGSGKTFIFEALAAELDAPVLVLKNIRSQWFGQTDIIFERLKRVLEALSRAIIFIDEADTQFGGVGPNTHSTERRLTGKIQSMMSDNRLKGRIFWLLMTARINLLSPDIRRPGRAGDLIIPVLDPTGDDRDEFIAWAIADAVEGEVNTNLRKEIALETENYSAADFSSLKNELAAQATLKGKQLQFSEAVSIARDRLSPMISDTRRYQSLQAMLNCTRKSLLPFEEVTEEMRRDWAKEATAMEGL